MARLPFTDHLMCGVGLSGGYVTSAATRLAVLLDPPAHQSVLEILRGFGRLPRSTSLTRAL